MGTENDRESGSSSGFDETIRRLAGESPGAARSGKVVKLTRMPTPLGAMIVGATDGALRFLEFADPEALEEQLRRVRKQLDAVIVPGATDVTRRAADELASYFAGELTEFSVPMETGGTEFQEAVWSELRSIPYGTTRSYGEQARRIGRPEAVRAVARANGDNPIAIVVPCHRVIGGDGTLTGYGGGLWRKKRLLELEQGVVGQEELSL